MDTPRCNSPGHTWMACTHMEALYGGHTCKPWIHLECTHLEWTHLDDMYPPGWFKIIGYTWKVWTHQEALNTGAMEPLMDSSRQLPWISMTHDLTDKDVFWKWSSWQEHWLKDQCRYPILLHWRMWSPGTPGHGVIFCYPVPLGPLLRGPCHFGPSCAEKTTALKLVLLLWIVDTVSESMTFVMARSMHSMKPSETLWTMG